VRRAIAAIVVLLALSGIAVPAARASVAPASPKIVLVVGATGTTTPSYRSDMDVVAATAAKYSTNVVKVYSPNATWATVKAAIQGANVVVYMGHGNGFPSPYSTTLHPDRVDGFGLNATAGKGDSNNTYYGEQYIASQVKLAPNAVVILSHLCYASGNSEPGKTEPSLAVAKQRLDNFAAGFTAAGAAAVIADGHNNPSYYMDALFSTHKSIEQLWRDDPWSANHIFSFDSVRTAGYTAFADPSGLTGTTYTSFYRSLVVRPGVTTDDFAAGTVPPPVVTPVRSTYHAVTPARLLDTRKGLGLPSALLSGVPGTFQVTGKGGVPADATAVTGNLTVTGQTASGYLFLGPFATTMPTSSTLNFPMGDTRANGVTVALGDDGTLSVTYVAAGGKTAHAILDVTGYFTADTGGTTYHAVDPARLVDTRSGLGLPGALPSGTAGTFQVTGEGGVPDGAIAVTGNVTVTGQTAGGYLFLGPKADDSPGSSTLNFPLGDNRANGVTVALGSDGKLSVTYVATDGMTTQVIFDVTGYFTTDAKGASYYAMSPTRLLDTRARNGLTGASKANVARTFQVTGRGGVPANATAVTGNLTVTGQTAGGYLFVGPVATGSPGSSTLNFPMGDTRANGVTVALGAGGKLSVTYVAPSGKTANVIFDVTGYFTP